MDSRSPHIGTLRGFGRVALVAGFAISLISMSADHDRVEPHFLAALLVLTGLGLRMEAAILGREADR